MIPNFNPILRIILICLNLVTILISGIILIAFRALPRIQENPGKLLTITTILEILFSFMVLLSQFYQEDEISEPKRSLSFRVDNDGPICIALGTLDVLLTFTYFFVINIFGQESRKIFQNKVTKKTIYKKLLISLTFAILITICSTFMDSIGYNDIGICSTNNQTKFNFVTFIAMLFSFIFSIYFLIKPIIKVKHISEEIYNDNAQEINYMYKRKIIIINSLYFVTFDLTRVLPLMFLTASQICDLYGYEHFECYTPILILISIGGLCQSILRSFEPVVKKYIISIFDCFQSERKISNVIQMQNLGESEIQQKSISLQQIIDNKIQNSIYPSETTRVDTISSKKEKLSHIFRKTHLQSSMQICYNFLTPRLTKKSSIQFCNKSDFYMIFLTLYELSLNSANEMNKIEKFRPIDYRYLSQKRFQLVHKINLEEYLQNLSKDLSDESLKVQCNQNLFENIKILPCEQQETILVTMYAEQLFNQIYPERISQFKSSFQPNKNAQLLLKLDNNLLYSNYFAFETKDGEFLITFITKKGKYFFLNMYIKEQLERIQQTIFMPLYFGLYSFYYQNNSYNLLIQKSQFNIFQFHEHYDCDIEAIWNFQSGQSNYEYFNGAEIEKYRLKMSTKRKFIKQLNQGIEILKSLQLWGYSFTILYFHCSQYPHAIQKDKFIVFKAENKEYFFTAYFGNLFDGFLLDPIIGDQSQQGGTILDPEVYAQCLLSNVTNIL